MVSNQTVITEFFLVGFPGLPESFQSLVSIAMFLIYIISLTANGSVIAMIILNIHLHNPMYLIIGNLAASNLLFDTVTLPLLTAKYWIGALYTPFHFCIFQMFCIHYFGSLDSFLLMLMAVDRYIAICHPLRYNLIITNKTILVFCGFFWILLVSSINIPVAVQASQIVLCGQDKINTLFCVHAAVMSLTCTDALFIKKVAFVSAMVVLLVPLGIILLSYIMIAAAISSSNHSESWQKALYTCTTHLCVVFLYYTPRIFVYIVTNIPVVIIRPDINALLLFFYSVVPHLANPIVYFLRTNEIKQTLKKVLNRTHLRLRHAFIQ
ncbi:olfactory receptor 1E16-like [Gastrophryne carolinensis]